jgi:hypothetical protein
MYLRYSRVRNIKHVRLRVRVTVRKQAMYRSVQKSIHIFNEEARELFYDFAFNLDTFLSAVANMFKITHINTLSLYIVKRPPSALI